MARLTIAEALREGLHEEMARDERVFCMGEDIGIRGGWGGAFTVTLGLETPDKYEVLSGLNEGDLVVIGNRTQFQPGQKVDPQFIQVASTL